jgi:hypothetical protein
VSVPTRASIRKALAERERMIWRGPPGACQVQRMGYLHWHWMAEDLTEQGERQALCAACERWKFKRERCAIFRAA